MIRRQIAYELGTQDMDPCPFTIATSIGGSESPSGFTKLPLQS